MKTAFKYFASAAVVLTASLALAGDKKTFTFSNVVGSHYSLRLSGKVTVQGGDATINGLFSYKVTKADKDVITTQESTGQMSLSINGQEMQIPQSPDRFEEINPQGVILSIKGDGVDPAEYLSSYMTQFVFSKDPVGVGDSWTYTYPADSKQGTTATTSNYKITGTKTVNNINCFEVQLKTGTTVNGEAATVEGTAYINQDDGSLVKINETWTNVPVAGSPMPVSGTFTLERVLTPSGAAGTGTTGGGTDVKAVGDGSGTGTTGGGATGTGTTGGGSRA